VNYIGAASASLESSTRAREFVCCAKSLLAARGNAAEAARYAEHFGFSDRVVRILKGAVTAGSTGVQGWAQELVAFRLMGEAFAQSLRNFSAFDTILGDRSFRVLPLHTRIVAVTSSASAGAVAEGAAIPATRLTLSGPMLVEQKVGRIFTTTNEVARSNSPASTDFIDNELRIAISKAVDAAFLSTITAETGVATISSSGMTGAQFLSDLSDALSALSLGANSRVYAIASQNMLNTIGLLCNTSGSLLFPGVGIGGGTACGVRFLASNAANVSDAIILVDGAQVAVGTGLLTLDTSFEAAIQLDDAPGAGAQSLTSLWQANLAAIRCMRFAGYELLHATGASIIDGVAATI
jgi:capsid protein